MLSNERNAPVAVFDSGAGGIAVLRAIRTRMPQEELLYFGDSANAPYGEKDAERIKELVLAHADQLLCRAKALVLACNTATAVAALEIRRRYPDAVVIGMEPALRSALCVAEHPRVLVMATDVTLREGKFAALLQRHEKCCTVFTLSAPDIVRMVEQGEENSPRMGAYIGELLAPYRTLGLDAVVLGCTHFCFARAAISSALGGDVPVFDGISGTVSQLARRLEAADLLTDRTTRGAVRMTSSNSRALPLFARLLFGE